MNQFIGVKTSQEKEGFTSCQSPKCEDRKEPKFDILLCKQGGARSLNKECSQRKTLLGQALLKHLPIWRIYNHNVILQQKK